MPVTVTAADIGAVLIDLGATGGQCLPAADLALGATKALALTPATPVGAAVWLATMTQESAYLRTTEEYGSAPKPYDPERGRTFEQVTHRANYESFGRWCASRGYIATADLFVRQPKLLAEMQWAWLGGVWFFAHNDLWRLANVGDHQSVQCAVYFGSPSTSKYPDGWDARLDAYRAWTSRIVKPGKLEVNGVMDLATSKRLQQWLGVGMDGDIGTVTYRALQKWLDRPVDGTLSKDDVRALQRKIDAYVDGDWGKGTTKDLQRYLNVNGV